MVLAVEVEDLGIAAGPQDRYAQAHEGLVLMDFAGARPRVEALDPALLPALYLAWRSGAAETSHAVHGGLRERGDEPRVRAGMARLAGHARAAAQRPARRRPRRLRRARSTPRSTSARPCSTSIRATRRWCTPPAPRVRARTTRARAARSSVPCLLTASSPWRARCARWTARSSRRASAPRNRLALSHGDRPKGSSPCQSQALTTFSRPSTRRSTASRPGPSASCPSSRWASSCWQVWNEFLHWSDIAVFGILYVLTGFGVTVGFHRLFTHRSFATKRWLRGVLAVLRLGGHRGTGHLVGGRPSQAPRVRRPAGRPAQPARRSRRRLARRAARPGARAHGLALPAHPARIAQALRARPARRPGRELRRSHFLVWAIGGLGAAFGLGWLIGGTLTAALTGLLWGGAVRLLVLHHVTFSINSLCHFFGRQRFETGDESRNLAWLSLLSFGEAWHNNHHAFPTSAAHGMRWYELDTSSLLIRGLETRRPRVGRRTHRSGPPAEEAAGRDRVAVGLRKDRSPAQRAGARRSPSVRSASPSGTAPRCRRRPPGRASRCARRAPLAHALYAPGQLGLGRAYVSGELEVDDIDATIALLQTWKPPALDRAAKAAPGAGRCARDGPRAPAAAARSQSSCPRGAGTRSRATGARCATTTTSRRSSSRSSSTSR